MAGVDARAAPGGRRRGGAVRDDVPAVVRQDDTVVVHGAAKATQTSLSAFQAFSFVEAAVLLVSAGVLAMLFARAEGRVFQLPGSDGVIVMIAGGWTALLIFYRLLDKPELQSNERITATVGVEWGIFIALLLALGLVYAGGRMRASARSEPPLLRQSTPPAAIDMTRNHHLPRRSRTRRSACRRHPPHRRVARHCVAGHRDRGDRAAVVRGPPARAPGRSPSD